MINWSKILGNALVAFATAGIAVSIVGVSQDALAVGILAAAFQGILAFGAALQDEGKTPEEVPSKLNNLVMF